MTGLTDERVHLDAPSSVVVARRQARAFAKTVGLGLLDQTRFATAVSEIARNAVLYAGGGDLTLSYRSLPNPAVVAVVKDDGPGIPDLDAALSDEFVSEHGLGRGLSGTRAIVDRMNIDTSEHGTVVEVVKFVSTRDAPPKKSKPAIVRPRTPEPRRVESFAKPADPLSDLRDQNEALLHAISGLVEAERALSASQKHLALAIDIAGIGTFEWDDGGAVIADERCHEQHGRAVDQPITTLAALLETVHKNDRELVRTELDNCLTECREGTIDYRTRDDRWLAVRLYADNDETKAGSGVAAVLDVTERRRVERETKQRLRFQQQLIGIVSHDLRSPLQVISTAATLLPEFGKLSDDQARAVDRIESSVDRATRLVQDVLDFAKSSLGGRLPVERRPLDLAQLARHIVQETQTTDDRHIVDIRTDDHLRGEWDADRLAQVVTNLLHNAFLYSPTGSTVTVTVRAIHDDQVELSVHNIGDPVPADVLPILFEPLSQRRGRHTRGRDEIGLGLYIVRAVAVAHNGQVRATSSENDGTTISVVLPRT